MPASQGETMMSIALATARLETAAGETPAQHEPQPNQPDRDPGQPEPGSREFPEEGGSDQVGLQRPDSGTER